MATSETNNVRALYETLDLNQQAAKYQLVGAEGRLRPAQAVCSTTSCPYETVWELKIRQTFLNPC